VAHGSSRWALFTACAFLIFYPYPLRPICQLTHQLFLSKLWVSKMQHFISSSAAFLSSKSAITKKNTPNQITLKSFKRTKVQVLAWRNFVLLYQFCFIHSSLTEKFKIMWNCHSIQWILFLVIKKKSTKIRIQKAPWTCGYCFFIVFTLNNYSSVALKSNSIF